MAIAKKRDDLVIEKRQRRKPTGLSYGGKPAGSWGHAATLSFYPGKNLGAYGDRGYDYYQ